MPKIKLPRTSPSIDMTPMVDLAFLLVTFFMLTTKFRPEEQVKVVIPASVSDTKIPENVITLSVDSAGRVFFDMEGKDVRPRVLQSVADYYKQPMDDEDYKRFSVMGPFGVPVSQLKQFIESNDEQRKAMSKASAGIPADTLKQDELYEWVYYAYLDALDDWRTKKLANPGAKPPYFAIKADNAALYNKKVQNVIDICEKAQIRHFDLITTLKSVQK